MGNLGLLGGLINPQTGDVDWTGMLSPERRDQMTRINKTINEAGGGTVGAARSAGDAFGDGQPGHPQAQDASAILQELLSRMMGNNV
jgi:hypothetical protein